jgi:hypothetical protein
MSSRLLPSRLELFFVQPDQRMKKPGQPRADGANGIGGLFPAPDSLLSCPRRCKQNLDEFPPPNIFLAPVSRRFRPFIHRQGSSSRRDPSPSLDNPYSACPAAPRSQSAAAKWRVSNANGQAERDGTRSRTLGYQPDRHRTTWGDMPVISAGAQAPGRAPSKAFGGKSPVARTASINRFLHTRRETIQSPLRLKPGTDGLTHGSGSDRCADDSP